MRLNPLCALAAFVILLAGCTAVPPSTQPSIGAAKTTTLPPVVSRRVITPPAPPVAAPTTISVPDGMITVSMPSATVPTTVTVTTTVQVTISPATSTASAPAPTPVPAPTVRACPPVAKAAPVTSWPAVTPHVYLGVGVDDASPNWRDQHHYERAVHITLVQPNSPASRAGLQKDDVIVSVNHWPVGWSKNFHDFMAPFAGKVCRLIYYRGEERKEVKVTLNN